MYFIFFVSAAVFNFGFNWIIWAEKTDLGVSRWYIRSREWQEADQIVILNRTNDQGPTSKNVNDWIDESNGWDSHFVKMIERLKYYRTRV